MNELLRTRDLAREGGPDRALRRSAVSGASARVARGRYLPTPVWDDLDHDDKYRLRIHAFVETTRVRQVLSHWSAAALWGYPIIGAWPRRIHVTFPPGTAQRSTSGVVRHIVELPDEDVVELDGEFVTSPLRTIVDLARVASFASGVAACDRALATPRSPEGSALQVERDALVEYVDRLKDQRGVRQSRSVVAFADGRSGSPGESFSRVQIARLGLPKPELQVEVVDLSGRSWHSDFGWDGQRLLGEFDGKMKYTRDRYLRGRSVADVVIEEKQREDAMRLASGCGFVRWTWSTASELNQLQQALTAAGLRPESRPSGRVVVPRQHRSSA